MTKLSHLCKPRNQELKLKRSGLNPGIFLDLENRDMAPWIVRVKFTQPKENTSGGSLNLLLALGSAEEACALLTLGLGALVGAELQ